MNIRSLLDQHAENLADHTFIINPTDAKAYTYAETRNVARAIAYSIRERGVKPGESVAFAMQNSIACAFCILGIMYGGYRATAVNLVSGNQTIAYVLEHSEAQLIFSEAAQHALLDQAFATNDQSLPVVNWDNASIDALIEQLVAATAEHDAASENVTAQTDALPDLTPDTDALLMYTSGTTGRPKGVLLSHRNLLAGGKNTQLAHELSAADRAMCVLPLYHINGLVVTLMGPLVSGGSLVLPVKFSTSAFWPSIIEHNCTWFSVVPTQISYLLHAEAQPTDGSAVHKTLRFGRSASAPLSPEVQQSFENRFGIPIIETMGLTETSAQILSNPLPPAIRKIGSPGIAFGDEVMIGDNELQEVPNGVEGEILIRGDNVMKGYLKNPDATAEAITPTGWLRTGDLGKQDKDGYVYVTGRSKELIIKGGENIAPREVDEALYRHPGVIEAAAFACPCENYGQRVEAAVAVDASAGLDEVMLLEFCRDHLGQFKMPDRIHFLKELPKGPSGKIQRRRLVELFVA